MQAEDLQSFAARMILQAHPPEVDLRRAISSLYYGLFHRLTEASAGRFAAGGNALMSQVTRAHSHGVARKVCERYTKSSPPFAERLQPLNDPLPDEQLRSVAAAFVRLQEARHGADYDLSKPVTFDDALDLLTLAQAARDSFATIEHQAATAIFLAAMLLDDRWTRNG